MIGSIILWTVVVVVILVMFLQMLVKLGVGQSGRSTGTADSGSVGSRREEVKVKVYYDKPHLLNPARRYEHAESLAESDIPHWTRDGWTVKETHKGINNFTGVYTRVR